MNQATNLRRSHLGIWSRTCVLYAGSLTLMAPTWLAERIYILSHISLSFKCIIVDIEPIMTRESVWEEPITNAPCSSFCVIFSSWNVKSLKMYVYVFSWYFHAGVVVVHHLQIQVDCQIWFALLLSTSRLRSGAWVNIKGILKKTLPKALRTQALTALTSNFGLIGLVQYVW